MCLLIQATLSSIGFDDLQLVVHFFGAKPSQRKRTFNSRKEYESNGIYQNGNIVGTVDGEVDERDGQLYFSRLIEATNLNTDVFFEYQRFNLRFLSFEIYSATEM